MDLVKVSPDFGYGPEGGETRTYKVSRKGLLSVQYMTSDLVLIAGETNLDLNEFAKNNGVIQRKTVVSESSLDEDGSTTYRSGVRLETCTLK